MPLMTLRLLFTAAFFCGAGFFGMELAFFRWILGTWNTARPTNAAGKTSCQCGARSQRNYWIFFPRPLSNVGNRKSFVGRTAHIWNTIRSARPGREAILGQSRAQQAAQVVQRLIFTGPMLLFF